MASPKKVLCLLLLGIALAKAAPAPDMSDFALDNEDNYDSNFLSLDEADEAAEEDVLAASHVSESDFDMSIDNNGDELADEYNTQILLHGRRGAAPSFWNSVKNAAIGAGKAAASHLAQAGLKALSGQKRDEDDGDRVHEYIADVADNEFEAMGKRMVEESLAAATREAAAYGNPGIISMLKSGASRVWNTVKPIAKEIGRKVAGVVANHLNSYASGHRRSAEAAQQIASVIADVSKRAARDLAHATAKAIQDQTNIREPKLVHGNMRSARAVWDAINTASVNAAKVMARSPVSDSTSDEEINRVSEDLAHVLATDGANAYELMRRDPNFLNFLKGVGKGVLSVGRNLLGVRNSGTALRDAYPGADPFMMGSLLGMAGKALAGIIGGGKREADPAALFVGTILKGVGSLLSHVVGSKRSAANGLEEMTLAEFDRDEDVQAVAEAMADSSTAMSLRSADPGIFDVIKTIGKGLLGFRGAEAARRTTDPGFLNVLGKIGKSLLGFRSTQDRHW
ncbi:uncharacterized protein LOC135829571 isoform X2 [Sycon ciliatum]|uniref:uncharacterized protein LOC135829571 isoform X2 n=1 Tax=Sycon ciliatum TaxID=27933 RepID=UPI0031F63000